MSGVIFSGDGDGYGYGYGKGYGDGDGDGYGYGKGYGDGDGDGYGNGYGYKAYWLATVATFAEKWTQQQQARLAELQAAGATIAFWRSNGDGTPANGGVCAPVTVGTVHEEPGPLRDECGAGQLHATLLVPSWKGDRVWIVAMIGEVRHGDDKLWGLKREIIGEAL